MQWCYNGNVEVTLLMPRQKWREGVLNWTQISEFAVGSNVKRFFEIAGADDSSIKQRCKAMRSWLLLCEMMRLRLYMFGRDGHLN